MATYSHLKDLPTKSLGVELDTFEPKLNYPSPQDQILHQIKNILPKVKEVILATDPDRERRGYKLSPL